MGLCEHRHRTSAIQQLPIVTGVKGVNLADGHARFEQEVATGMDVYEVPLPAIVTVKEGLNLPRYPTLKGRLGSKKVAVDSVTPAGAPGGMQMITLVQTAEQKSNTIVLGHGPDAAPAVVDLFEELGLLK